MKKIESEEVKRIEIELLLYIDKICRANGIKYSLFGGTLLGAIRHKGFIPWDDDIDICVLLSDYYRLIDILKADNKYRVRCDYLEDEYYYYHAKLVDTNTFVKEPGKPIDNQMGVWVDIFPVCGIPNNINQQEFISSLNLLNNKVYASIGSNYYYDENKIKSVMRMIAKFPFALYCKIRGTEYWKSERKKRYELQPIETADYLGIVPTQYGIRTICPRELFQNYINIQFEQYEFMSVKNWDLFLSTQYGDYMTLPPKEKRVTTHFEAYYK